MNLLECFKLPEVRNPSFELDDPETTLLHGKIIKQKRFLKELYMEHYRLFQSLISNINSKICVELGSGGGFIKEIIPSVITSDVLKLPNVDMNFSALDMPFNDDSIDAFFMIDVLHHIKDPQRFFGELTRCLKAQGQVVMIEPANTLWGQFIYKNFHHEDFDPTAGWFLTKEGPLSSANGALPWIIFKRDRKQFEEDFSLLKIVEFKSHTPLRYLLSGGLSFKQIVPTFTYSFIKGVEFLLSPFNSFIGMFSTIRLEKTKKSQC